MTFKALNGFGTGYQKDHFHHYESTRAPKNTGGGYSGMSSIVKRDTMQSLPSFILGNTYRPICFIKLLFMSMLACAHALALSTMLLATFV